MTNYIEELSVYFGENKNYFPKPTTRRYFGKYPFCVNFHHGLPDSKHEEILKYLESAKGSFYRMRNRVFFETYDDTASFVSVFSDDCSGYNAPRTQQHLDCLYDGDLDVEIRESYFWGQYRYLVKLKNSAEADTKSDRFYDTYLQHLNVDEFPYSRLHYSHDSDGHTLYLNNYDDLVFIKVGLGEYIQKIKKAIKEEDI